MPLYANLGKNRAKR